MVSHTVPPMNHALVVLFALGAIAAGAMPPVEDHHEHPTGVTHSEEDHRHGDADDHHETPDSPCHHHDSALPGCACGPSVMVPAMATASLIDVVVERARNSESRPRVPIFLKHLAHVPLA